jgi:hypothetical protein
MATNRKSTINKLDPRIQDAVNSAIKENRASIDDIVGLITSMGGEASRSAVGRYVKTQGEQLAKYREAQEVAKVWVDKLGKEPDGDVGRLIIEMLRVVSFQTLSNMESAEPEDLMLLGNAIKNIAQADKLMVDKEFNVRKLVQAQAVKAAEEVTKTARKAGMSAATVDLIRAQILGIGEAKPA